MHCTACPRQCPIDRSKEKGYCQIISTKEQPNFVLARAALHMWEEPCISGTRGSGTVFFSGCNLRCIFCQNHAIALSSVGRSITPDRLIEDILSLQRQGANNINLVTASHYIEELIPVLTALRMPQSDGKPRLHIPIVYNCGGYESVHELKKLEGLVDVYLPDFKYMDTALAARYSRAADYPKIALDAIKEMVRQTGSPRFQKCFTDGTFSTDFTCEEGIMTAGVIVRHLILPGQVANSKACIETLYETFADRIYISIMNQYTPIKPSLPDELGRKVTTAEYDQILSLVEELGITYGFVQEGETAKESFIPDFMSLTGV